MTPGDLRNDNQIIKWMLDELKQSEIKAVTVAMLNRLIERNHNLAVVFLDENTSEVTKRYREDVHLTLFSG